MIKGCTTSTACNYNSEAKEDDNSCIDPLGCDNWCPGDTTDVKELDCAGICGGIQFIDCSGQCGILIADECGVCGGNNAICTDCNGVVNGEAELDICGDCVGGDTGLEACNYDCLGIWGGDAKFDECGVCDGIVNYVSGTCNDCAGMPYGTAYIDGCEDCVGGNTGENECTIDCTGELGGTYFYDDCGVCVPEGNISCVQSCNGSWVNDGSQLVFDECNVCDGDNTVCAGCDGIPNSGLEIDVCGVCGGDGNCQSEDCTDDNVSGYCQDLSVLQGFIDNSQGGDNPPPYDLSPLDLGYQIWENGRLVYFCISNYFWHGICKEEYNLSGDFPNNISNWSEINTLSIWEGEFSDSLPTEIFNLTNLIELRLVNHNLIGEIPSSIENLTNLEVFDLREDLSGEIPEEIGNLSSLTFFNLGQNELTGEIPPEIGNLTSLVELILNENQLSGEMPSEIGNLTNLTGLNLKFNELSGEIPSEIGNLTNLTSLYLSYNLLTGEIPSEIWEMTNLTSLYLSTNQLTGEIPSEIGNLTNLTSLSLSTNLLTGEIPSEIWEMTNLTSLSLSSNQLTGEIPVQICNQGDPYPLITYNYLMLTNNQLCPPYPECIEDYVGYQNISDCPETVTDIDGNNYEIVQIGDQIWMAENLKTTHYNNGDEIPYPSNEDWGNYAELDEYGVYDNNTLNADIYGNLYNWYTVDDDRGVCPEGYHVPSDNDYTILTDYFGGTSVAGGKMKETGTEHWNSPNDGATNESGFTGLPSGYRRSSDGGYYAIGEAGNYWSSSEDDSINIFAYFWALGTNWSSIYRTGNNKHHGYSIRCIKD